MTTPLNDGELERIREHLGQGKALREVRSGPVVWQWAETALEYLERLLEEVQAHDTAEGGTFARGLRAALEERVLRALNGRATLTSDTRVESLSVHVIGGFEPGVVVDVRLRLGVWKQ